MSITWDISCFDQVDSTQDIIKNRAIQDHASEGLVIQAQEQLKGRGRHGHRWVSKPGNLYMSILLKPNCLVQIAGQIGFLVCLAVHDALSSLLVDVDKLLVKWPNDILYDGQKIAGILIETDITASSVDGVFLGMGVNINFAPDDAVKVNEYAVTQQSVNQVRDVILKALATRYQEWQEKGFDPIRKAWLNRAYGIGQEISARMPHKTEKGIFAGIDRDGALRLQQSQNIITIQAASIHFGVE